MSVATPPKSPVKAEQKPEVKPQAKPEPKAVAPQSVVPSSSPSSRLRALVKRQPLAEAVVAHREWTKAGKCPDFYEGEPVFYRSPGRNEEFSGTIMRSSNWTFDILVQEVGKGFVMKQSCSWYDHTIPDAEHVCDPKAPHNNNGTFRRTPWGEMLANLFKYLKSEMAEANAK